MNSFGELLQNKRKIMNLTQLELANRLNVSDKTISKWETGRSYPDLTVIQKIAHTLNTTVNELLSSDDLSKDHEGSHRSLYKFKKNMIIAYALLTPFLLHFLVIFAIMQIKDEKFVNTFLIIYFISSILLLVLSIVWTFIVRLKFILDLSNSPYKIIYYLYMRSYLLLILIILIKFHFLLSLPYLVFFIVLPCILFLNICNYILKKEVNHSNQITMIILSLLTYIIAFVVGFYLPPFSWLILPFVVNLWVLYKPKQKAWVITLLFYHLFLLLDRKSVV